MTPEEFAGIAERMVLRWPSVNWDARAEQGSIDQMFKDLADLPGEQVDVAAEAWFREGNEWPPTAGQLRSRVAELALDAPDWTTVARELRKGASQRTASPERGEAWLRKQHPLVRSFVVASGWKEIEGIGWGNPIIDGQVRKKWEGFVERVKREAVYVGLPAAGLPALERLSHEPKSMSEIIRKQLPGGK